MNYSSKYFAIIPAAGKSYRMETTVAKPFLRLKDKTIIEYSINPFLACSLFEKIAVVVNMQDSYWKDISLQSNPKVLIAQGDEARYLSVFNGLLALDGIAQSEDWILVHDAARPCIKIELILKLIEQVQEHSVGGILTIKGRDTIKQASDGKIFRTIDRNDVWFAQTPQMFRYGKLYTALQNAIESKLPITDEAQAIEMLGLHPVMVEGCSSNIKVTYPEDLPLAEFYLEQNFSKN